MTVTENPISSPLFVKYPRVPLPAMFFLLMQLPPRSPVSGSLQGQGLLVGVSVASVVTDGVDILLVVSVVTDDEGIVTDGGDIVTDGVSILVGSSVVVGIGVGILLAVVVGIVVTDGVGILVGSAVGWVSVVSNGRGESISCEKEQ